MPELRLGDLHDGVVIHRTCRRQDHLVGAVAFGDETRQVVTRELAHPFGGAEDRAAKGLGRVGGLLQPVEDDVVGGVQRLSDLLQDHVAFYLDLVLREDRVQHDVRNDVQRKVHVPFQHPRVIGGHLAAGIGVDITAHILDRLGDGLGRTGARPLEGHVLQEMGDAVLVGPFVPAAGHDPDADTGGFEARHVLGHDPQPVGQPMGLHSHLARRSSIRASRAARSGATRVMRSGRS